MVPALLTWILVLGLTSVVAFLSYLRLLFPRIARVSVGGIIACGCLLSVLLEISHAALKSLPMDTSNGNQKTELISMGNPNRS